MSGALVADVVGSAVGLWTFMLSLWLRTHPERVHALANRAGIHPAYGQHAWWLLLGTAAVLLLAIVHAAASFADPPHLWAWMEQTILSAFFWLSSARVWRSYRRRDAWWRARPARVRWPNLLFSALASLEVCWAWLRLLGLPR